MKEFKLSSSKNLNSFLNRIVKELKKGKIIVYPTDTAYGLGGDALNEKVIQKVYLIKKRIYQKPLPIIAGSFKQINQWFFINPREKEIIQKYWPGPLTLLLKPKMKLPKAILGPSYKVAVRIPAHFIALELARRLAKPLISTSANISGKKEIYNIREIKKQFQKNNIKPDLILNGGSLIPIKPSTIIELKGNKIKVLREGPIKFKK